jgi:hypothetical protein
LVFAGGNAAAGDAMFAVSATIGMLTMLEPGRHSLFVLAAMPINALRRALDGGCSSAHRIDAGEPGAWRVADARPAMAGRDVEPHAPRGKRLCMSMRCATSSAGTETSPGQGGHTNGGANRYFVRSRFGLAPPHMTITAAAPRGAKRVGHISPVDSIPVSVSAQPWTYQSGIVWSTSAAGKEPRNAGRDRRPTQRAMRRMAVIPELRRFVEALAAAPCALQRENVRALTEFVRAARRVVREEAATLLGRSNLSALDEEIELQRVQAAFASAIYAMATSGGALRDRVAFAIIDLVPVMSQARVPDPTTAITWEALVAPLSSQPLREAIAALPEADLEPAATSICNIDARLRWLIR